MGWDLRQVGSIATLRVTAVAVAVVITPPTPGSLRAQAGAAAPPRFETVSIKADPGCFERGLPPAPANSPNRLALHCMTIESAVLSAFVSFAGGVNAGSARVPIEGAPEWVSKDLYTIDAVVSGAPPRPEVMRGPMLQALLEERLKLRARLVTREVPVYDLVVRGDGHRLKPFDAGTCTPLDLSTVNPAAPRQPNQPSPCRTVLQPRPPELSTLGFEVHAASLDDFSRRLGLILDRPVVNRTGLDGRFDFLFEFAVDQTTPRYLRPTTPPSSQPSVFQAIQDRLGLKLEPARGPGTVLVIDHIERPSEN